MLKPNNMNNNDYIDILNKNVNLDWLFFPNINLITNILKPVVDFNKPMIFKALPGSLLIKALSMFSSLESLSTKLSGEYLGAYGSYEVISRIRIGYVYSSKKIRNSQFSGGGVSIDDDINNYIKGFELMYGDQIEKLPTVTKNRPTVTKNRPTVTKNRPTATIKRPTAANYTRKRTATTRKLFSKRF
jgi:hypothetical protein